MSYDIYLITIVDSIEITIEEIGSISSVLDLYFNDIYKLNSKISNNCIEYIRNEFVKLIENKKIYIKEKDEYTYNTCLDIIYKFYKSVCLYPSSIIKISR